VKPEPKYGFAAIVRQLESSVTGESDSPENDSESIPGRGSIN